MHFVIFLCAFDRLGAHPNPEYTLHVRFSERVHRKPPVSLSLPDLVLFRIRIITAIVQRGSVLDVRGPE